MKRSQTSEKRRVARESCLILFMRAYMGIMTQEFQLLVLFLWIYRSSLDLRIREGLYHDGEAMKNSKIVDDLDEIEVLAVACV